MNTKQMNITGEPPKSSEIKARLRANPNRQLIAIWRSLDEAIMDGSYKLSSCMDNVDEKEGLPFNRQKSDWASLIDLLLEASQTIFGYTLD